MEKFIKVKQATKQGWIACQEGGGGFKLPNL